MRPFARTPAKGATRAASLLSALCTVIALANLPAGELPLPWLLAFVLPGAAVALACRKLRGLQARTALGIVLQLPSLWVAFELAGPLSRPIALACTILPPLGFATMRNHEADRALALFLGFCVLLVGTILDGLHVPLIAAYTAAACLALRCASHLAARANGRPAGGKATLSRAGLLGGSVTLIAGCWFTVFVIERTLEWLPSPTRARQAQAPAPARRDGGERRAGLAESFDLDGGGGVLGPLAGERLVRVRRPDGSAVPRDLYLRSSFFAVAGLDRWQVGALEPTLLPRDDDVVLRPPVPGEALEVLEIERFGAARQYVFVPPDTCELARLPGLAVDPVREWIRQRESPRSDRGDTPYRVAHHDLPPPGPDARLDPRARRLRLFELPPELDRAAVNALLDEWRVGADALTAMASIEVGLAHRCRYDRKEPGGPYAHAIENFLFAGGDHAGYCMHFASAAALLLRARGIPCRIGVGVFGGAADRERAGARVYGSQHAHAWVEVPFDGRGWVVFDPTPPAERGQRAQRFEPIGDEPSNGGDAAPDVNTAWQTVRDAATQPWALLLLLALLFAASTWSRRAVREEKAAEAPVARTARRLLARLLRALADAGHPRTHGQTLEALAGELRQQSRLSAEIAAAFAAYQQVRFGGRPFDDEREAKLRAGVASALALRGVVTS